MVDLSSLFLKEYTTLTSAILDVKNYIKSNGYNCMVVNDNKEYINDLDNEGHALINVCLICF